MKKLNSPQLITAQVARYRRCSSGGIITFNPQNKPKRPTNTSTGPWVYASHCDWAHIMAVYLAMMCNNSAQTNAVFTINTLMAITVVYGWVCTCSGCGGKYLHSKWKRICGQAEILSNLRNRSETAENLPLQVVWVYNPNLHQKIGQINMAIWLWRFHKMLLPMVNQVMVSRKKMENDICYSQHEVGTLQEVKQCSANYWSGSNQLHSSLTYYKGSQNNPPMAWKTTMASIHTTG